MSPAQPRLGMVQIGVIILTVATAIIHFALAFDWLFVANGVGYLVLVAALYAPVSALRPYRNVARWGLMLFTAVTVVAWLLIGVRSAVAYLDKAIELLLIVLLYIDWQQSRR